MNHLYVVGDIHGCVDELDTLLRALPLDRGDTIVFVGDYIDRGPASAGVVGRLLELRRDGRFRTVCLKGNHEDMFLDFMGYPGNNGAVFLYNGGAETLLSYGLPAVTPGPDVATALPADHLEFFRGLETTFISEPYLVAHAGINPGRSFNEQREEDLLWIRDRFIARPHPLPYTVVFGHTPQQDVLLDLPYKIGLDTGCVYGNKLSCIELAERRLFQVKKNQRRVQTRNLSPKFEAAAAS
jgi:serine/threonine protein phosphatase 1